MKKKNTILLLTILFTFSCNQEDQILQTTTEQIIAGLDEDPIILKERVTKWIEYESNKNTLRSTPFGYAGIPDRNLLGFSLKDNVYPIEDTRNLGNPVIDLGKFAKENPSMVRAWKNNTGAAAYYSYATFDRYVTTSTITEKVNNGFNLNLGLFSIGNKKDKTSVFSKSLTEDKNTTFGELNIVIRDSIYRMQYSSEVQKKIQTKYLTKDFKNELYNTHPSELFYNYGGFVLSEFVSGGLANAMYAGVYRKTESNETKEKNMDREIDASFGFTLDGKGGKISGNVNLGRGNSGTTSITNEFSSIMMSIKTVGGNSSFASFSVPKEVKNTSIDLSAWVNSLNDKRTHSIIEIGNNGLIPISDFIVEENLQNSINKYYATGVQRIERLNEPYITIDVAIYNPQFSVIVTYLHDRYGNENIIKAEYVPSVFELLRSYTNSEAERVYKMFAIKVINNLTRRAVQSALNQPFTNFDCDMYNESYLKKFTYNGTIYLVSDYVITRPSHPRYNQRYALSIHNDRIINDYAMRALINRLPSVTLNYENFIRDYKITAL